MTITLERPPELTPSASAQPARRAIMRWAWRLFRREWRQHLLVLALLTVAVAATTAGLAVATNTQPTPQTTITLPGRVPNLAGDVAAIEQAMGKADVILHQKVDVPGSVATIDLRAQDSNGGRGQPTLHLVSGRYPSGADEVALTGDTATLLGVHIGDTWQANGRSLRVVGVVENPTRLDDQFALVAPGQLNPPDSITVEVNAAPGRVELRLPDQVPVGIAEESHAAKTGAAIAILALATIGLLFVGLVAVAGFTVMAHRRLRALGVLGSIGATDRHIRLVMLADGAAVGAVGALVGTAVGLGGWLAFAPTLENVAGHRIDRFNLTWWAMAAAIILAVLTAIGASWWPARAASKLSVVTALSGRPPRPQPAHRSALLGSLLLGAGLLLLALTHQRRPVLVLAGIVVTTLGILLLAPLTIRALASFGSRAPVAVRLAWRDLARYQARSGAALGAITLAVGIAATIAVSATASEQVNKENVGSGNLAANQMVVYLSQQGAGPVPALSADQQSTAQAAISSIAASLPTKDVVALEGAVNPTEQAFPMPGSDAPGRDPASIVSVVTRPGGFDELEVAALYVATPDLLARYGIKPSQVDPAADVLTSRTDFKGLQLGYGPRDRINPKIQNLPLPRYTSGADALITENAVQRLGLQVVAAAWILQTPRPLTSAQAGTARRLAAAAGLSIETRPKRSSLHELANIATAVGILLALGVLAMTVGLIRSEAAGEIRILTAGGASSSVRRTLTGATAGALALLGAVVGTAGAYLALIAWHRSDLNHLSHVPTTNLLILIVGLPLVATVFGWLLAGREPAAIARQPLD